MATKEEILDAIAGMSVLELSELLKDFEEKFGVSAAAPVAVAAAPAAGGGGEAAAEKDEFDVVLTGAGDKKIQVIKEVRAPDRPRERLEGRRREGKGRPRGCWRHCRTEVIRFNTRQLACVLARPSGRASVVFGGLGQVAGGSGAQDA